MGEPLDGALLDDGVARTHGRAGGTVTGVQGGSVRGDDGIIVEQARTTARDRSEEEKPRENARAPGHRLPVQASRVTRSTDRERA